ncbi:MAG: GTPase ObgE [Bdellovibrionales bacterium]|nr:GTPase ObgE [Bdellovibrionales bacterium]
MRFIDEAKIKLSAGRGGPGCVSFRRETFEPRGGPDGGEGGAGGDVTLVASSQLSTLQDFRFKREYRAGSGEHGSGSNKSGRDGEDIELRVPVGTIIRDADSGEVLIEFMEDGQKWLACKGGRGGKGNSHFVSSTFQAPRFAQPGEEGEFKEVSLELKLLADAAILGFPNAGKSTLISRISAARPKIADYAFTTLTPNLGVVSMPNYQSFVVADIPGLIEGAHRGMGLGHRFLKHIERTRVFIHLMDGTKILEDVTKPGDLQKNIDAAMDLVVERYKTIRNELGLFNEALLHKPEIVALNKVDLFESDPEIIERARLELRKRLTSIRGSHPIGQEPYILSGVTGRGIPELLHSVFEQIQLGWEDEERSRRGAHKTAVKLPDDEGLQ